MDHQGSPRRTLFKIYLLSHSEAQLATGQGLRFLSSKPVILVLGQGVEEH